MNRLYSLFAIASLSTSLWAQSPEKISYQAVVRNSSNELTINTEIGMQISILQGPEDLSPVYTETQTPTTNANGLISIEIGTGTSSDDFSTIGWSGGTYFIKTEIDPSGGTNYSITGTSQLLSVPYALHAKTAESLTETIPETDPVYSISLANGITEADTANWNNKLAAEIDADTTNEIQSLSYTGNSLSISNGNSVTINESKWTTSGNDILFNGGLVGIGLTNPPVACLDVYDNVGYPFFKFVSEDNVYTHWISDRLGVDDYQVGIDGGNNKFIIANTSLGNFPIVIHRDKIGINMLNPEVSLHIKDVMKLEPRNSAPSSPTEGMIYYNNTDHKVKVYTGSSWEDLN